MKKTKSALSVLVLVCAIFFSSTAIVRADDDPCLDGQVPIGSRCLTANPSTTEKTEPDIKSKSEFDLLFEWLKAFGF